MDERRRIAIYGGTFDPVHIGHLEIARRVVELFEIDQLLFVPATHAPHKLEREVTLAIHRHAMLVLATQQDEQIFVSIFELEVPDRRYTIETLAYFRAKLGDSVDLFFVMGSDSWSEITTWHRWKELLTMANYIVVTRPGYDIRTEHVTNSVPARVIDLRSVDEASVSSIVRTNELQTIFITDVVMRDISATEIRNNARAGSLGDLSQLVPPPVADYIRKYKLYRNSNEA